MRFEQLPHLSQIKTLERLHKYINQNLFENKLSKIDMDIVNIHTKDAFGMFSTNDIVGNRIAISYEMIDVLSQLKYQKEQALCLGAVILHEMIHQYCYENNIDDSNHGGMWYETAKEHGLISIYENGELVREELTISDDFALSLFTIRK